MRVSDSVGRPDSLMRIIILHCGGTLVSGVFLSRAVVAGLSPHSRAVVSSVFLCRTVVAGLSPHSMQGCGVQCVSLQDCGSWPLSSQQGCGVHLCRTVVTGLSSCAALNMLSSSCAGGAHRSQHAPLPLPLSLSIPFLPPSLPLSLAFLIPPLSSLNLSLSSLSVSTSLSIPLSPLSHHSLIPLFLHSLPQHSGDMLQDQLGQLPSCIYLCSSCL